MFKIVLIDFESGKRTDLHVYETEKQALMLAVEGNKGKAKDSDYCYVVETV